MKIELKSFKHSEFASQRNTHTHTQTKETHKMNADIYKIIPNTGESEFITAYFEAVNFTETGEDGQPPYDADLDEDFRKEGIVDCMSFYQRSRPWLSDNQLAQAGHDFWLTRNGHGSGFWDKENIYPQAELLTKLAESYGEADEYA